MTPTNISNTGANVPEKVGVLLVHGIGEQRRFEHLESEARKIIDAIIEKYGAHRHDVTTTLETGYGDGLYGEQMSWVAGRRAPLHALVKLPNRVVDIAFHEVWWADVNENLTLGKQLRFWFWGLALPGNASNSSMFLPGSANMRFPTNAGRLVLWARFRISFVSAFVFMSAFSIALINLVLRRLRFQPVFSSGTVINFLSGIKLYSQTRRAGGSPLDGPDDPPRVAIRRRMVRAIVDAATQGYDRWYILAHSLGTVVAWNGLMETDHALPNYLDKGRWQRARTRGLAGTRPGAGDVDAMMPARPLWLSADDVIDRDELFKSSGASSHMALRWTASARSGPIPS
jgi:hypothetical protein